MIPDIDADRQVYLNGEMTRLGDAKISVLDRGFIFGDGIYEVVPAYNGKPFRMEQHLARLRRSLDKTRLQTGWSEAQWRQLFDAMIEQRTSEHCMVYLQITRGVAKREHGFPEPAVKPTIFAMTMPFERPDANKREQGLTTVSMKDERWLHCDIKSISLLGNVFAKQHANDRGVDDVIQFRDGYLSEASSANIWMVKNGTLLAPVRNEYILEGIRYALLQELAEECGVAFESRAISQDEVSQADELMLTSATKEVLPITQLDGKAVGNGRPGPVYAQLRAAYDASIERLLQGP